MKLLRYESSGRNQIGILNDENILQLGNSDITELMPDGAEPLRSCMIASLSNVRILPPLIPGKILAIGRNYAEHAKELNNEVPTEPLVFAVMPSAVIGDGDVIEWERD